MVMHGLVNTLTIRDKPIINDTKFGEYLAIHAGFFPYFPLSRGGVGFTGLHMTFRHGPQETPPTVKATAERNVQSGQINSAVWHYCFRQPRHHQPTSGGFDACFHARTS